MSDLMYTNKLINQKGRLRELHQYIYHFLINNTTIRIGPFQIGGCQLDVAVQEELISNDQSWLKILIQKHFDIPILITNFLEMETIMSDEQIMAMLEDQKLKDPKHRCCQGRPVIYICHTPNCNHASLHCGEQRCKCTMPHIKCQVRKIEWFADLLNSRVNGFQEIMIAANQTILNLISELNKSQKALIKNCMQSSLTPRSRQTVDLIYNRTQGNISGREGRQFVDCVSQIAKSTIKVRKDSIGWYKHQMDKIVRTAIALKERLIRNDVSQGELGQRHADKKQLGESQKAWFNRKLQESQQEINKLKWQLEKYREKNQELIGSKSHIVERKEPSRIYQTGSRINPPPGPGPVVNMTSIEIKGNGYEQVTEKLLGINNKDQVIHLVITDVVNIP